MFKGLTNKPPFTADEAIADMIEGGREDWGYAHERKAFEYKISAVAPCPDVQPVLSLLQENWVNWLISMAAGLAPILWHLKIKQQLKHYDLLNLSREMKIYWSKKK